MKKLVLAVALAATALPSLAVTWWVNGVLYGNVCRNGVFYTVYPVQMGQPVGTVCPIRNTQGQIVLWGTVSNE